MANQKGRKRNLGKVLGPGILFASTAIGVSHLVQSTQAGASYGFALLWAVILANLFKYPFFEYGSRYASATGTSLIDGYRKMGKSVLMIYFFISIISTFLVIAAVGFVTSGFMQNLFAIPSTNLTTIILFAICILILISGRYNVLDKLIKLLGIVLLITTVFALVLTFIKGPQGEIGLWSKAWFPENSAGIFFLLALMGWMPTALDIGAWSSLWIIEKEKNTGYKPSLKETLFDFNFGYISTAILSICFVSLGAFILFGTEEKLADGAAGFASGVVGLYTTTMGQWAYPIIASCAFSIMFSTCITVIDGYSRNMKRIVEIFALDLNLKNNKPSFWKSYRFMILLCSLCGISLIFVFQDSEFGMKGLVNIATTMSFIVAPFVAIFNVLLVRKKNLGELAPPPWLRILSYLGIIFLSGFTIYFLMLKFNLSV
tara:strand:- start:700 stop:1989 length:1290 start_codon:yes stop_codon:yes gene_type:complete